VGASDWLYFNTITDDPEVMLAELHRQAFASGEYHWAQEEVTRPDNLAGLHELYGQEENEALATNGTHSILDIFRVLPAGSPDEFGAVMPLSEEELLGVFPEGPPSREEFEAAHDAGRLDLAPRWSGRFTVIMLDGKPHETAVWGFSGD